MLALFSAVVAPVVIGIFLPTTDLKIDSQKDYVQVTCESPDCAEKKTYTDQGYTCGTDENQFWCSKDVMGFVAPSTLESLKTTVISPWVGYQLEIYEPRSAPELTFNSDFYKQWQVDQKVWLSNEAKNISRITYDLVLSQNSEGVHISFHYGDLLDMSLTQDQKGQDLWRPEIVEQGSPTHFIKSAVRLRWVKQ